MMTVYTEACSMSADRDEISHVYRCRELAKQTFKVMSHFCSHTGLLPPLLLVGGTDVEDNFKRFTDTGAWHHFISSYRACISAHVGGVSRLVGGAAFLTCMWVCGVVAVQGRMCWLPRRVVLETSWSGMTCSTCGSSR